MSPTQTINQAVSAEIRAHLGRIRMTQQQLASALQWNPRYLSRRINGECGWTVEEVAAVAQVLGVPVTDLAYPRAS